MPILTTLTLAAALTLTTTLTLAAPLQITATSPPTRTPLVELYTSEGCSSCPPADRWLRRLGTLLPAKLQAVPLAFHVDYWDYLGWHDPFAQPAFGTRQRAAPTNRHRTAVYTPQVIVDGKTTRAGDTALLAIRTANAQPAQATIRLHITRTPDHQPSPTTLQARIQIDAPAAASTYTAHIAIHESNITRHIAAGENRGATLHHDFVVRHLSAPIPLTPGTNHTNLNLPLPANWRASHLGLAVIVTETDSGTTIQSITTPLAPLFPG